MTRSRYLVLGVAVLAVTLFAVPASATHNTFVTISASSAYAGVCDTAPGDVDGSVVSAASAKFAANRASGTLGANEKVPADLGPTSGKAGACDSFGTDAIWSGQVAAVRGTTACKDTTQSAWTPTNTNGCRGLHLPGYGAPARPGRFLNSVNGAGLPTAQSTCQYVTTVPNVPTQGSCAIVSVGYVLPGESTLGGYCGSSRGFSWAISAPITGTTASFDVTGTGYSIAEWQPNSAGTILPIQGSTTGTLWAKTTNGHYNGWSGTPGTASLDWNGTRNIFGLATARSYVNPPQPLPPVDSQTTGSCSGAANAGALQFFSQLVTVNIGN